MSNHFYLSATTFPADQAGCYEWLMRRKLRLKCKKNKFKKSVSFFIRMYHGSIKIVEKRDLTSFLAPNCFFCFKKNNTGLECKKFGSCHSILTTK